MSKRKTTEEFIQDAVKIHGNRYDYSLIDYKGAAKKVIIILMMTMICQYPTSYRQKDV